MLNIAVVDPSPESAAETLANKRAAARAAAQEYHQLKVEALHQVGRVMSANGGWYTAKQIADATGLTSGEAAAQFGWGGNCKAATEAGLYNRVHTEARTITRRFVEVGVDGIPINDRIYERHEHIIVYGADGVDGITCNH